MKRKPPTLTPTPRPGNRVAIYIRVSTVGQAEEGFSLEAQLKACRQFAETRGWEIIEVYEEPGVSAKDDNRPAFQRMIRAAEAGKFDYILTHKLDRFSRSLLDIFTYLRDMHEWGVAYASASEQFDFSTPIGKVLLALMAAMAQWYLDNLSQETQKGKRARAEAGFWNGDPPFGYRVTEAGELEINEDEARGVRLAFEQYAAEIHSDLGIAQMLNAQGFRTKSKGKRASRPFSKDTVRRMLLNRTYLGEVKYRKQAGIKDYEYYPGQHPAIIELATWDGVQRVRARRYARPQSAPAASRVYPLSSLAVCGECGTPMRGHAIRQYRYYKDPALHYDRDCAQAKALVPAGPVEEQLISFFGRLKITPEIRDGVIRKLAASEDAQRVARERATHVSQLHRAQQLFLMGDWAEAQYLSEKARVDSALALLQPVQTTDIEQAATLLQTFGAVLDKATLQEQQLFYHAAVDEVFVKDKKVVAIRPKPNFYDFLCMPPADPTGFAFPSVCRMSGHLLPCGVMWPLWTHRLSGRRVRVPRHGRPIVSMAIAASARAVNQRVFSYSFGSPTGRPTGRCASSIGLFSNN